MIVRRRSVPAGWGSVYGYRLWRPAPRPPGFLAGSGSPPVQRCFILGLSGSLAGVTLLLYGRLAPVLSCPRPQEEDGRGRCPLGEVAGMSFFAPPAVVKRMADDRAIAEADLSHLKTI